MEMIGTGVLLYSHPDCKCYDPWDATISEILEFAETRLGIDAAYARIGENFQ